MVGRDGQDQPVGGNGITGKLRVADQVLDKAQFRGARHHRIDHLRGIRDLHPQHDRRMRALIGRQPRRQPVACDRLAGRNMQAAAQERVEFAHQLLGMVDLTQNPPGFGQQDPPGFSQRDPAPCPQEQRCVAPGLERRDRVARRRLRDA
ncbi:hypothetical protein U879_20665 [Defluviimonas sp. 20V17]|uniref:Uncharacterized protein n=1 Tax=Allgaiera indica TaxID=765699 RepID=A0AAN4US51_9RHOB|nr:hypothetical protein [Allgaiera indica]KDB01773.1 hypothetical protein U879_20665 [Defluviimonas sp. 20V17]GHE02484.1 hypothetical protein GCM10008024_22130 [Allgaiera indica]